MTISAYRNGRSKRGTLFTLLELLVVIAIISILMAILLPALKTAKDISKNALCQSNLKQIYTGVLNYANDNVDYFPTYPNKNMISWPVLDDMWRGWPCEIGEQCGMPSQRNIHWTLRSWKNCVFNCPAEPYKDNLDETIPQWGICYGATYRVNYGIMNGYPSAWALLRSWKVPERKVLMADCGSLNLVWSSGSGYGKKSWMYFRHIRSANILFFAGHIVSGTLSSVPQDTSTPATDIWWNPTATK